MEHVETKTPTLSCYTIRSFKKKYRLICILTLSKSVKWNFLLTLIFTDVNCVGLVFGKH